MKQTKPAFRISIALLACAALAFGPAACQPSSFKSQRNLAVKVADSHEKNLAAAEEILGSLDSARVREQILAAFPGVTSEQLEQFEMKTAVVTLGEESTAMIQTSLSYTDTDFPANEIMDFVQGIVEKAIADHK